MWRALCRGAGLLYGSSLTLFTALLPATYRFELEIGTAVAIRRVRLCPRRIKTCGLASWLSVKKKSWDGDPTPGCDIDVCDRSAVQGKPQGRISCHVLHQCHHQPQQALYMRASLLLSPSQTQVIFVTPEIKVGYYFCLLILLFPRGDKKKKQGLSTPPPRPITRGPAT